MIFSSMQTSTNRTRSGMKERNGHLLEITYHIVLMRSNEINYDACACNRIIFEETNMSADVV